MLGYFTITFTFMGTLIGAGFASGREIAEFFRDANLFSIILSGVATGALAYPFLRIGAMTGGDLIHGVCGKHAILGEYMMRIINFLVLATVLAASEHLIYISLGFHGGAIITGLASLIFARGSMNKLKIINALLVPLIIVLVVILVSKKGFTPINGSFKLLSPILYSAMNVLSAGLIAAKMSAGLPKKGALTISAMIAICTTLLLLAVRYAISGREGSDMPIYYAALDNGLGTAGALIIYAAIFTTAAGTLRLAAREGSDISAVIALSLAFILSVTGFKVLVEYGYPLIGVAGCIFIVFATIRLANKKINQLPCNNSIYLVQYERYN